jgi:DNA-binding NtrC family response regulator
MNGAGYPHNPVLVVDDEESILKSISSTLITEGIENLETCSDSRQVMIILSESNPDVLLLDLTMPFVSGRDLLPSVREEHPDLPVIVITGSTEVAVAVDCMKLGVFDYLVKPIERSKLLATVRRALTIKELERENRSLKKHLLGGRFDTPEAFSEILTSDPKMQSLMLYLESIAPASQTVLITGETGTGKELIARALHRLSGRKGEMVAVNIAGLDDTMFSDTLFGHVKGAFSGASDRRSGLIERAAGGTLFLDEIGDLQLQTQVKLLRLLESREYYPLGSDLPKRADARVIVATNRDLGPEVAAGGFRKDLYYRLATHHVHVPPLRERRRDLRLLFQHFLKSAAAEYRKPEPAVPDTVYDVLGWYDFPGNVRELKAVAFHVMSRTVSGPLDPELVENCIGRKKATGGKVQDRQHMNDESSIRLTGTNFPTIKQATEQLVDRALELCGGNQRAAAGLLGISPPALSKRLRNRST